MLLAFDPDLLKPPPPLLTANELTARRKQVVSSFAEITSQLAVADVEVSDLEIRLADARFRRRELFERQQTTRHELIALGVNPFGLVLAL